MAAKKVLLTGGDGFLGGYTARALVDAGYAVKCFDISSKNEEITLDCEYIQGDIQNLDDVVKAAEGCDYIYHLAGIADIEEAKSRPLDTGKINIQGTLNALEAAQKHNIERFVFASTVYVYSDRGSFYRVSKQACENYIETYSEIYDIPYTILRYGSLYGRQAHPENGIYKLISSAMETGEIIYNGDENAMREYIHVSDAAELSVKILDEEYKNQHIILTGSERMKIVDVMRMISEMMPNKPEVKFGEKTLAGHYVVTPYSYNPKLGRKLIRNNHIELGQGLLDCIAEAYEKESQNKGVNAA